MVFRSGAKNPDMHREVEEHDTFIPICKIFRPLLNVMTLVGLYHDSGKEICVTANGENIAMDKSFRRRLVKYYHLFITILMIVNAMRYIPSFWVGQHDVQGLTINRVMTCSWLIQCAITGIILYVMCEKSTLMPEFINKYNSLMTDEIAKCIKLRSGNATLKIYARVATTFAVLFAFANFVMTITLCIVNEGFRIAMVNPFDHDNIITTVMITIPLFFASTTWIFPTFFFIGISCAVSLQFKALNNKLVKTFKDENHSQLKCFKHLRRKHNQLCQAIDILDRTFRYLIMNYFGINIFLNMLIVYNLINAASSDTFAFTSNLIWFIANTIMVLVISYFCTNVTEWVSYIVLLHQCNTMGKQYRISVARKHNG
jgi:hypothetical protein